MKRSILLKPGINQPYDHIESTANMLHFFFVINIQRTKILEFLFFSIRSIFCENDCQTFHCVFNPYRNACTTKLNTYIFCKLHSTNILELSYTHVNFSKLNNYHDCAMCITRNRCPVAHWSLTCLSRGT